MLSEAIPSLRTSTALTYIKLRGGVAQAGNISVGAYQLQNVFNPGAGFPFGGQAGFELSNRQNDPNLQPEFTTNREVGLEMGFFDRFNVEAVYYSMTTTNQTVPIQVSRATGYVSALVNTGSMTNKGIEIDLKTQRPLFRKGGFSWTASTNFTFIDNKVTAVYGDLDKISIGSPIYAAKGRAYPVAVCN